MKDFFTDPNSLLYFPSTPFISSLSTSNDCILDDKFDIILIYNKKYN